MAPMARSTAYVALGDSFTEGVGDPDPARPNGLRGWADRVAEVLAAQTDDFGYANLAIRGRKLRADPRRAGRAGARARAGPGQHPRRRQRRAPAARRPRRPRRDVRRRGRPARRERRPRRDVHDLRPGQHAGSTRPLRGRMAIFNELVREIADRHDATLVDMWRMRDCRRSPSVMDTDRMHLNAVGHQHDRLRRPRRARRRPRPGAAAARSTLPVLSRPRAPRARTLAWTRDFLGPWVHRRLTGRSSGDSISPKRPALAPIEPASRVG